MNTNELSIVLGIKEGTEFGDLSAATFEQMIANKLEASGFEVARQVMVDDRGDGRRGRIDLVASFNGERIPIEIDRKTARAKSVFKVKSFNQESAYVLTRSPFSIIRVC